MLEHVKTLLIIALVASAVYLTGELWYKEISGSSITGVLLTSFSRTQPESASERNLFVKPVRIVTSFGNNRYDIIYNGIDTSAQKNDSDEAITLALSEGEYIGTQVEALSTLLDSPGYAYGYTAAVPGSAFVNAYPQRRNVLTSRVRSFKWVFIKPYSDSGIGVIFLDEADNRAHEYRVQDVFLRNRILDNIMQLAADGTRLNYAYEREFFIPRVDNYEYPSVLMENQYMDQGGLLIDYIKRKVDVFFGDAGSKLEASTAQSFTYSDENTVVKYFPAELQNGLDMLEYAYYKALDRRVLTTLSADYNTAARFISRDTTVENEYYLAAVDDTETRRVFYFNYAINDLPISLSSANTGQTGLMYPIEIVIEHGVVTRYRKLVYRFTDGGRATAGADFTSVISGLLTAEERPEDLPLSGVALGYKIDTAGELVLYWFLEIDGMSYVKSAALGEGM